LPQASRNLVAHRDRLEKLSVKNIDDALYKVDELLGRWDQRLTVSNLAFAKRYVEGECEIALFLTGLAKYNVAILQRIEGLRVNEANRHLKGFPAGKLHCGPPDNRLVSGANRHKCGVFIENVQVVQTPEGVCPSRVWFHSFDNPSCVGTNPPEIFWQFLLKDFFGGTYWEVGFPQDAFAGGPVRRGERGSEVIQAGPQIVDDIADVPAPMAGDVIGDFDPIQAFAGLGIRIEDDHVWITGPESTNLVLKMLKVLFGPVDFYPNAE
jgi:hypothetical protein